MRGGRDQSHSYSCRGAPHGHARAGAYGHAYTGTHGHAHTGAHRDAYKGASHLYSHAGADSHAFLF
ncbi:MAG: hypothetical protein HY680_02730 [Chloroflexi bacterium]|nr:hypothetical protein [Chloroflexota bacterium]